MSATLLFPADSNLSEVEKDSLKSFFCNDLEDHREYPVFVNHLQVTLETKCSPVLAIYKASNEITFELLSKAQQLGLQTIYCDLLPDEIDWRAHPELEAWATSKLEWLSATPIPTIEKKGREGVVLICDTSKQPPPGPTTVKAMGEILLLESVSKLITHNPSSPLKKLPAASVYLCLSSNIRLIYQIAAAAKSCNTKVLVDYFPGSPFRYTSTATPLPAYVEDQYVYKGEKPQKLRSLYKRLLTLDSLTTSETQSSHPNATTLGALRKGSTTLPSDEKRKLSSAKNSYLLPKWYYSDMSLPALFHCIDNSIQKDKTTNQRLISPYINATARNIMLGTFHDAPERFRLFSELCHRIPNWLDLCANQITRVYRINREYENRFLHLAQATIHVAENALLKNETALAKSLLKKASGFMDLDFEHGRNRSPYKVFEHVIDYHLEGDSSALEKIAQSYEANPDRSNLHALVGLSLSRLGQEDSAREWILKDKRLGKLAPHLEKKFLCG